MQRCIVQSSGHRAARGGALFLGPNPDCLPRSSRVSYIQNYTRPREDRGMDIACFLVGVV